MDMQKKEFLEKYLELEYVSLEIVKVDQNINFDQNINNEIWRLKQHKTTNTL